MRQPEIWGEAFFGVCLYYFATLLKWRHLDVVMSNKKIAAFSKPAYDTVFLEKRSFKF